MAKVLVIGSGGREHAIIDALSSSPKVSSIYCAGTNAAISRVATCIDIAVNDFAPLANFVESNDIDLTVVGPEVPLSNGIVDYFQKAGLRIFGPSQKAAMIESSKDFAKNLMKKYKIPTAEFSSFDSYHQAFDYVKKSSFPLVLKFDGLAAGKGVVIAQNEHEAMSTLKSMLVDRSFGQGKVVIEQYLEGPEFSFMCFVNGTQVYPMEVSQDHKRAYEGDEGPNTGGMGAYSPVPVISAQDKAWALEHIMKPAACAMQSEGRPFKGVLYGGLMKTAEGIKVIEFNCRFGDPETEVVLPRLETDLYEVFSAIVDDTPFPQLKWSSDVSLGFVMASKGYPGQYKKGYEIEGLDEIESDVRVYHCGTYLDGMQRVLTSGGRVLMVVGKGNTMKKAYESALEACRKIKCENLFFRSDIGKKWGGF